MRGSGGGKRYFSFINMIVLTSIWEYFTVGRSCCSLEGDDNVDNDLWLFLSDDLWLTPSPISFFRTVVVDLFVS
jgi:hypothetical protein